MADPQSQAQPKDAIDDFVALPSDQQLSTLQTLAPDKQDQLLAKVKERRGGTASPAVTASSPGFLQGIQNSFDTNTTTSPSEPLLQTGLKRVVSSIAGPLVHPLDALVSLSHMADITPGSATNPLQQRGAEVGSDYQAAGGGLPGAEYAGTKLAGDVLGSYLGGKIGEAGINAAANIPAIARGGADILAGTGPKVTAKLVADTSEANKGAIADAANTNATMVAKRAQQLQEHFTRTQAANDANAASQAVQSRKIALQRGVETLDPLHKTDLQNLEGTVRAEANRRYNELNGTLDPEVAPPDTLSDLLSNASENMKGSNTETPIMKDMEKRLNSGDPLTYRDLQGYRSELGSELQKGSLPGDVYHAYKEMQGSITDAMKDIADSRGLGDQFDAARDYYRKMSDTFDDPRSPIRRALNSTEPGGVVKAFTGKDKSGIEALAQYDPDLAQRINTTRGYAAEAKGIKSSSTSPVKFGGPTGTAQTAADTVKPGTPPVAADITQLGPEDIQGAKADALATRANKIRNTGHGLANTMAVLDGIRNIMHGNVGGLVTDIGARGGLSLAQHGLAAALEHPALVDFLTKPSAADLAELSKLSPAERTAAAQNLQPLIDAATAKGLRVAPAITSLFAAGASLPAGHPLMASQPTQ